LNEERNLSERVSGNTFMCLAGIRKGKRVLPLKTIAEESPGFPLNEWPLDLQGFTTIDGLLHSTFMEASPKKVLELGVWKGYSAVHWLRNSSCQLYAVDTWLGAKEMYTAPDGNRELHKKWGYPTLYYKFFANMMHLGYAERVYTVPLPSKVAVEYLYELGERFDFCYIDASHEYPDVKSDLEVARYVSPILTGDDYNTSWPGVVQAVDEFVDRYNPKRFETDGRGWVICL
jgi:hypothetical protein